MPGLGHRLEQFRTKIMEIESLSNRIKNLERQLEGVENGNDVTQSDDVDESIIWQSLDELRRFAERLSIAVTQLESDVEMLALSMSHLDDD